MNENLIVVISLFSMLLMLVFLFWLYRDYRVDCFRQEMFSLRDSLFDKAAAGELDFETDAYGMLRSTMNGFIRFGHKISFPYLIVSFIVLRHKIPSQGSRFHDRLQDNIAPLSPHQKKLILEHYRDMNYVFVKHLVKGSPLFTLTVLPPLILSFSANRAVQRLASAFKKPIDSLDTLAHAEGQS